MALRMRAGHADEDSGRVKADPSGKMVPMNQPLGKAGRRPNPSGAAAVIIAPLGSDPWVGTAQSG